MALALAFAAGLTLLGLAVGSFLTVVIRRTGTRRRIAVSRSRCPSCRRILRWFELVPLLSFIIQRGYCRSCCRRISWFYPAVEALTACLFLGLGFGLAAGILPPPPFAGPGGHMAAASLGELAGWFFYYAFFAASAVAVSLYDHEHQLVHPKLVRPLLGVGAAAEAVGVMSGAPLLPLTAAAGGVFLLFWSLWFFSDGQAMGRGDADVALAIVLMLGPAVGLLAMLFAFWLGAILGILLVLTGRIGWRSRVPFAPFLFAGALAALGLAVPLASIISLAYAV
ncbi:MAG: prepilin peptidase [Candidatus Sungbacteria bacterium]|uniref:Prepilin peptidase n=1 Tax=Candidatus Sungiibacteriota bacterium TaxID=2750080 RepID=A0A932YW12_9BACT|nr:prepilin peptidase [Candidatus Sungbacteria bacterium]